jgi:peptide deformylase
MKITKKTLYKVLKEDDFRSPSANMFLAQQLLKFMIEKRGIGLAANQVGLEKRLFVINVKSPKACFNPSVLKKSPLLETGEEGCLSFKGEYIPIDRPMQITVQYHTFDGKVVVEDMEGLEARCFLHELDHLNGITMHKRKQLNEST